MISLSFDGIVSLMGNIRKNIVDTCALYSCTTEEKPICRYQTPALILCSNPAREKISCSARKWIEIAIELHILVKDVYKEFEEESVPIQEPIPRRLEV